MAGYDNLLSFMIFTSLVSGIVMETQHYVDLSTGVVQGRRYTGYTYQTITECGFQQCLALCRRRKECQSVNYDKSHLHCELNLDSILDVTMLTLHGDYLYVDKTTAISFTKQDDACLLNLCYANSVCLELHDGTKTCIDQPIPILTTNPTTTEIANPSSSVLTTVPTTTEITYPSSSVLTTVPTTTEITYPSSSVLTTNPTTTRITYQSSSVLTTNPTTTGITYPSSSVLTTIPTTTGITYPSSSILTTNPTTTGITYPSSSVLTSGPTPLTQSAVAASCSSPYTYYGDADVCFWAVLGYYKENWHDAESACMTHNGHLARADSDSKISVVASLVESPTGGWVGAKYHPYFGSTVWVPSLATVEPQPVEHDGQCVTVNKDGVLQSKDCIVKHTVITWCFPSGIIVLFVLAILVTVDAIPLMVQQ